MKKKSLKFSQISHTFEIKYKFYPQQHITAIAELGVLTLSAPRFSFIKFSAKPFTLRVSGNNLK